MKGIIKLLKRIRYIMINVHPEYGGEYEDLKMLIHRAEKRKGIRPICRHCGETMRFRNSTIQGGGFGRTLPGSPVRDDQTWKCPNCFSLAFFGIPITKQVAKEELKLRKGRVLFMPSVRGDEATRRDIRERLKSLGYIDFDAE